MFGCGWLEWTIIPLSPGSKTRTETTRHPNQLLSEGIGNELPLTLDI